jgi:hypothetical protein
LDVRHRAQEIIRTPVGSEMSRKPMRDMSKSFCFADAFIPEERLVMLQENEGTRLHPPNPQFPS